jgi:hypothetical protein
MRAGSLELARRIGGAAGEQQSLAQVRLDLRVAGSVLQRPPEALDRLPVAARPSR